MKKIKLVTGYNYFSIEDTKYLTDYVLNTLIKNIMNLPHLRQTINIHINSKFTFEVDIFLINSGFTLHDENVTVYKILDDFDDDDLTFTLHNLHEISINEFKNICKQSMKYSLNTPSLLDIDIQMKSVELELGATYKDSCLIAFEKEKPISVIIPHIESGTVNDGRLFYFGIFPTERGKGKGRFLH